MTYAAAHGAIKVPELALDADTTGNSDFTLTPLALYWSHNKIHFGFAEYVVMPVGAYHSNRLVNPGLNYWSFDSNFSFTYLNPDTGREASFNIGHIYNTENPDTDYQTGQELHLDVMLNQFLSKSFGLGVHGFIHDQFSRDKGRGATNGSFKVESSGAGPALFWNPSSGRLNPIFVFRWLNEYHVENRTRGQYFFFTFALDI